MAVLFNCDINGFYISGPMSGYKNLNIEAFNEAEKTVPSIIFPEHWCGAVHLLGVINPTHLDSTGGYYAKIARDLILIKEYRLGLILLDGWQESAGARLETALAIECGLPVCEYTKLKSIGVTAFVEFDREIMTKGNPENVGT
jgi:hypothetical protein